MSDSESDHDFPQPNPEFERALKKRFLKYQWLINIYDYNPLLGIFCSVLYHIIFMWGMCYLVLLIFGGQSTTVDPPREDNIEVSKKMDIPCVELYGFTCRKTGRVKTLDSKIGYEFLEKMDKLIKNINDTEATGLLEAKKYYLNCIGSNKTVDHNRRNYIIEILNTFGERLNNKKHSSEYFWADILPMAKTFGLDVDHFISVKVLPDPEEKSYAVYMAPALPIDLNNTNWKEQILENISIIFEYSNMKDQLISKSKTIVNLVRRLMEHTRGENNENSIPIKIKDLNKTIIEAPWKKFIQNMLLNATSIKNEDILYVKNPISIRYLLKPLNKNYNDGFFNYFKWKMAEYLRSRVTKLNRRQCFDNVFSSFPSTLINRYSLQFPRPKKTGYAHSSTPDLDINNILTNVTIGTMQVLEEINWLNEETKKNLKNIINTTTVYSSYGNDSTEGTENLTTMIMAAVKAENPFRAVLSLNYYRMIRQNKMYGKMFSPSAKWISDMRMPIYPRYSSKFNSLYVPNELLQSDTYNPYWSEFANFIRFGFYLGQEISKGLIELGLNYTTEERYESITECLSRSWANYNRGMKAPNNTFHKHRFLKLRLREYIGLTIAHRAYHIRSWTSLERLYPNHPTQFWHMISEMHCSHSRGETASNIMFTILLHEKFHEEALCQVFGLKSPNCTFT